MKSLCAVSAINSSERVGQRRLFENLTLSEKARLILLKESLDDSISVINLILIAGYESESKDGTIKNREWLDHQLIQINKCVDRMIIHHDLTLNNIKNKCNLR